MNGFKKVAVSFGAVFVFAVFFGSMDALADKQSATKPAQKGGEGADPAKEASELKKRIVDERNKKIKEELDLGSSKASKLFEVLSKYDGLIEAEMRESLEFKNEVANAAKDGSVSGGQAEEFLKKYETRERAAFELRQKRHDEIKNILSSKEMLKFLIFERRFVQRTEELLAGFGRQGGPGKPLGGPGKPPGGQGINTEAGSKQKAAPPPPPRVPKAPGTKPQQGGAASQPK
ncbi:MAG: hypothetical protein OEV59_06000 [Deltaproteobacteria bacterium]|nr:hypothetical protein [Deltaproteobacteria bacterium]